MTAPAAASHRPRSARDRAKAWLLDELGAGPVAAGALKERARAAGIPWSTLDRAARDLNVVRPRQGYQGGSMWALPDDGTGQPLAGEPPAAAADSQTSGDDPPEAAAPHSHQPSRSRVSDLNDLNDLNDSNDVNDYEKPPASSHHSRQSGHSGGAGSGDANGHPPGEARPEAAGTAAGAGVDAASMPGVGVAATGAGTASSPPPEPPPEPEPAHNTSGAAPRPMPAAVEPLETAILRWLDMLDRPSRGASAKAAVKP